MKFAPSPKQVGMVWSGLVAVAVLRLACGWALPNGSSPAYVNNSATNRFQPYVPPLAPPRPALPASALVGGSPTSGAEGEAYLDLSQQGQHGRIDSSGKDNSGKNAASSGVSELPAPLAKRQAPTAQGRPPVRSDPVNSTPSPSTRESHPPVAEGATASPTLPAKPTYADYSQLGTPAGRAPPRLLVGLPHDEPTSESEVMNLATQGQATPTKLTAFNPLIAESQNITLTNAGSTSLSRISPLNPLDDLKPSLDQHDAGSPILRRIEPQNPLITDPIAIDLSTSGRLSSP